MQHALLLTVCGTLFERLKPTRHPHAANLMATMTLRTAARNFLRALPSDVCDAASPCGGAGGRARDRSSWRFVLCISNNSSLPCTDGLSASQVQQCRHAGKGAQRGADLELEYLVV